MHARKQGGAGGRAAEAAAKMAALLLQPQPKDEEAAACVSGRGRHLRRRARRGRWLWRSRWLWRGRADGCGRGLGSGRASGGGSCLRRGHLGAWPRLGLGGGQRDPREVFLAPGVAALHLVAVHTHKQHVHIEHLGRSTSLHTRGGQAWAEAPEWARRAAAR